MQRSSFAHTSAIRAYCQLYYCGFNDGSECICTDIKKFFELFLLAFYNLGQICDLVPECILWSWIEPGYVGAAPVNGCFLKNAIPASSTEAHVISGFKGCKSSG